MITLVENDLELGSDCKLVSCRFDPEGWSITTETSLQSPWGIALPEKLQTAVPKRKAEFIAGRYCARRAIEQLPNHSNVQATASDAIGIGEKRQPLWPPNLTGSITHSHGFAAAAVASTATIRSVGIDSEQFINSKTAHNVSSHILTASELNVDKPSRRENFEQYLTLVFSAKESIFKCLYPLVHQYFDFKDAVIEIGETTTNQFAFTLQKQLTAEFCQGYSGTGIYQVTNDFVHTAIVLNR